METKNRIVRKRTRTRFPATTGNIVKRVRREVKKITFDEITESLSDTNKTKLLSIQTEIQGRLINIKKDIS